jgi:Cellulase (glycosyl hydrolase family 5)
MVSLGRGHALTLLLAVTVVGFLIAPRPALAGRAQWSVFEDPRNLVASGTAKRESTLAQIQNLGGDTLRVQVRWSDVAPGRSASKKPAFDATNPSAYPGFAPYDDLIASARAKGMRVIVTITGDTPRWASAGGRSTNFANSNYKPSPHEYALFATAVAPRYSGRFGGLPAVHYFTIWNEPNHEQFLKPTSAAPTVYRQMVWQAVPAIKRVAASGTKVFVGETAPVGRAGRVMGPKAFIRSWLCLNKRLRAVHRGPCRGFKRIDADGYAHHPYGPVSRVPRKKDVINMLAIRVLAKYLDRAASAGRLPRKLRIYSTEFGLQSNPPDRSVSTTPSRQARLLNEKEEYSYRYGRLKSYSQYLLYDDKAASAFQTGLRFYGGKAKPALNGYRLPIVVHRRGRRGARIWGHVRPGSGKRFVQLYKGGRRSGGRITTGSSGYFGAKRARSGRFFFKAYVRNAAGKLTLIGRSRTARPIR